MAFNATDCNKAGKHYFAVAATPRDRLENEAARGLSAYTVAVHSEFPEASVSSFISIPRLAIALLLVVIGSAARAESSSPELQYIWIQDPWSGTNKLTTVRPPDFSLWNGARIEDYQNAIQVKARPPLGVLTISSININVPIYNGTDDFNLDRGAGRIKGMGRPGQDAHLALSGHRDGFFRNLKDIQVGDKIIVESVAEVEMYTVNSIDIVPKEDVSVLEKTQGETLTLITCYPFYFVGHAPERMVVRATPTPRAPLD